MAKQNEVGCHTFQILCMQGVWWFLKVYFYCIHWRRFKNRTREKVKVFCTEVSNCFFFSRVMWKMFSTCLGLGPWCHIWTGRSRRLMAHMGQGDDGDEWRQPRACCVRTHPCSHTYTTPHQKANMCVRASRRVCACVCCMCVCVCLCVCACVCACVCVCWVYVRPHHSWRLPWCAKATQRTQIGL